MSITLTSTAQHCHELQLGQSQTVLTVLMLGRLPAGVLLKQPGRVFHIRLEGEYLPPFWRKSWKHAAPVPPFEFEQKLRLALRQVVLP